MVLCSGKRLICQRLILWLDVEILIHLMFIWFLIKIANNEGVARWSVHQSSGIEFSCCCPFHPPRATVKGIRRGGQPGIFLGDSRSHRSLTVRAASCPSQAFVKGNIGGQTTTTAIPANIKVLLVWKGKYFVLRSAWGLPQPLRAIVKAIRWGGQLTIRFGDSLFYAPAWKAWSGKVYSSSWPSQTIGTSVAGSLVAATEHPNTVVLAKWSPWEQVISESW